jgi:hypothetical protein
MINRYVFIPSDSILSQSVSEYPIYVELSPESIFCQKLELIYSYLFSANPKIPERHLLFELFERKHKRSLERQLSSTEEQRSRAVFSFLTMAQIFLLIGIIGSAVVSIYIAPDKAATDLKNINPFEPDKAATDLKNINPFETHPIFIGIIILLFGLALVGAGWTNLTISKYYRDITRFEYRLLRKGRRRIAIVVLIRLLRMIAARIYLIASALLFTLYGIICLIGFGALVLMGLIHLL